MGDDGCRMSFINLVWLIASVGLIFAQVPGEPPAPQTYSVLRLKPTAFQELPKDLVAELQRRGCTIP